MRLKKKVTENIEEQVIRIVISNEIVDGELHEMMRIEEPDGMSAIETLAHMTWSAAILSGRIADKALKESKQNNGN